MAKREELKETRELLARAVERLDQQLLSDSGGSTAQSGSDANVSMPCPYRPGGPSVSAAGCQPSPASMPYPYRPGPSTSTASSGCLTSQQNSSGLLAERKKVFKQSSLFSRNNGPKNKRRKKSAFKQWEHDFICLANAGQCKPPTPLERAELFAAGLGQKAVLCAADGESWEFHEELMYAYPKLKDGGGYELLRTSDKTNRELSVIPSPPGGYTASFVKSIVLQAKVYVRPLQHNLSLEMAGETAETGVSSVSVML